MYKEKKHCNNKTPTFAFVSNEPKPQKVPPPIDVPPILTYVFSDSTCSQTPKTEMSHKVHCVSKEHHPLLLQ